MGKGDFPLIRYLVGALALGCGLVSAFADEGPIAKNDGKPPLMRFEWRVEGPAETCRGSCRVWISATGVVTENSVNDFSRFAKDNDLRGLTLVLDSEGGSVVGALALGRAIRKLDMTTTVGRTIPLGADKGGVPRATLSPKANCESMCAFLLLAGMRRYVPPQAHVLVHQIWLGNKAKRALESNYSAHELSIVERDIGSLARYTAEMGGGMDLLETALGVPPWEPMHRLSADELRQMRLTTVDRLFEPEDTAPAVAAMRSKGIATAAQGQHSD
jgi:hypothetical protein